MAYGSFFLYITPKMTPRTARMAKIATTATTPLWPLLSVFTALPVVLVLVQSAPGWPDFRLAFPQCLLGAPSGSSQKWSGTGGRVAWGCLPPLQQWFALIGVYHLDKYRWREHLIALAQKKSVAKAKESKGSLA